jgi:hypothetical protein
MLGRVHSEEVLLELFRAGRVGLKWSGRLDGWDCVPGVPAVSWEALKEGGGWIY